MVFKVSQRTIDGQELKLLLYAGVSWLSQHVDAVNRMNVFPVPDGDTGINMYHTLKRAYQEIESLNSDDVGMIARRFAHGALMGARGNSGTILSQLLKGFADGLGEAETLNAQQMLVACEKAVELAYLSVKEPVEGTILTVARESVESLKTTYQSTMPLEGMLGHLVESAEESLYNTPNLLPVLKKAGVVDSGGMGLFFFLQGMARYVAGEEVAEIIAPTDSNSHPSNLAEVLEPEDKDGYGYDVQFLMYGDALDVEQIREDYNSMGWSVLVVGDRNVVKVHIHVHNPAEPIDYAIKLGAELDDIVVENMQRQFHDYVNHRQGEQTADYYIPAHGIAVIAVASGDGIQELFRDIGVTHVIAGGQTMNPSTEDFLNIVDTIPTDKIVLLPNNSNIILTAEQTAKLASNKHIRVIPSKTIPQGINAVMAYGDVMDADTSLDDMVARMQSAMDDILTAEVTRAIRSVDFDGTQIVEGQYMGLINSKIALTAPDLESTVIGLFDHIDRDEYELVTLYYGDEVTESSVNHLIERLSNEVKGLEFEAVYGGQPLYPYLISVE